MDSKQLVDVDPKIIVAFIHYLNGSDLLMGHCIESVQVYKKIRGKYHTSLSTKDKWMTLYLYDHSLDHGISYDRLKQIKRIGSKFFNIRVKNVKYAFLYGQFTSSSQAFL
jgi:hypothetical protein